MAEREVQRLAAEGQGAGRSARIPKAKALFPPLIDALSVQSGYEAALAAALGDDLQAPLDDPRRIIGVTWAPLNTIRACPMASSR